MQFYIEPEWSQVHNELEDFELYDKFMIGFFREEYSNFNGSQYTPLPKKLHISDGIKYKRDDNKLLAKIIKFLKLCEETDSFYSKKLESNKDDKEDKDIKSYLYKKLGKIASHHISNISNNHKKLVDAEYFKNLVINSTILHDSKYIATKINSYCKEIKTKSCENKIIKVINKLQIYRKWINENKKELSTKFKQQIKKLIIQWNKKDKDIADYYTIAEIHFEINDNCGNWLIWNEYIIEFNRFMDIKRDFKYEKTQYQLS
jgi:hypothetical protein